MMKMTMAIRTITTLVIKMKTISNRHRSEKISNLFLRKNWRRIIKNLLIVVF